MWSALGSLVLPHITKYLTPVMGVGCLLLGICYWYQHNEYENICGLYDRLQIEKEKCDTEYALEKIKFNSIIDKQNISIEQYKLDLEQFTSTVNKKEKELAEARFQLQEQVNQELAKDSSSDNQLAIISKVLYDFSKGK